MGNLRNRSFGGGPDRSAGSEFKLVLTCIVSTMSLINIHSIHSLEQIGLDPLPTGLFFNPSVTAVKGESIEPRGFRLGFTDVPEPAP